jgi:hypothetical protein
MITLPEKCLRGHSFCQPYAQIKSTDNRSFICCGAIEEKFRGVPQDEFALCWFNDSFDEMSCWDRRDLISTISVISQALTVNENVKCNNE